MAIIVITAAAAVAANAAIAGGLATVNGFAFVCLLAVGSVGQSHAKHTHSTHTPFGLAELFAFHFARTPF